MAGEQQLKPVVMEGVRIIFRNFKGDPSQYNREGVRNFGVILPTDVAEAMARDGWNVKTLKPTEEEKEAGVEQGPPWLPVEVAFDKGRPPKIVLITSRGKTHLDEGLVDQLDWAEISIDPQTQLPKCDMIVRPYFWTNAMGASGVKAYLKSMYVTIEEDDLERKYSEMNEQHVGREE
jgi:hypothetical protein